MATTAGAATSSADARAARAILHVDMDAFYASVEQRDDPTLRGKPVIVGGRARRGVVLAASYEVRPFGVRSAMPMARALALAPDAVVVPPRHDAYAEASARVFDILCSVTPLVRAAVARRGVPGRDRVAEAVRRAGGHRARGCARRIADEVGLPASAGIAEVKFVAKIASDLAKPNGQLEVPPGGGGGVPGAAAGLAAVGRRAEERARPGDDGVRRPWATSRGRIRRRCAPGSGRRGRALWEQASAIDRRPVIPDREAKSIGAEDTFDDDLSGVEALRAAHARAGAAGRAPAAARRRARADRAAQAEARGLHAGHPPRDAGRGHRRRPGAVPRRRRRCSRASPPAPPV